MPRTSTSDLASQVVGEHLRAARIEMGLKQSEVAQRLGATAPYVSNVEAGRVNLTIGQVFRIADAIGVTVDLILRPAEAEEDFKLPDPRLALHA
jgi:transcriptional regulator with XRE-family HTH domain